MKKLLHLWLGLWLLAACGLNPTPAPPTITPTTAPTLVSLTPPPVETSTPLVRLTPAPTPTQASIFPPITAADWQFGPATARVTIIMYADFQCADCLLIAAPLARLRREYPNDFRLVYRHFPLTSHDKARLAAEATEAAGAQDKFWEMHDALYASQQTWITATVEAFRVKVDELAHEIALDEKQFAADLESGKFKAKVEAAYQTAKDIPLYGVPLLLFNGVPYQGPQNHWAFVTLVELEKLKARQFANPPPDEINPFKHYTATLVTEHGPVVIQLLAEKAPVTVNNFVFLVRQGWYNGVTFHKVIPGYLAQTGDPSGTGLGGPGYIIPNEIAPEDNFDAAGWVGMANVGPNTAGGQFFITLASVDTLNGTFTLFGKVVSGLDVLKKLSPRDPGINPELPPGDKLLEVTIEGE